MKNILKLSVISISMITVMAGAAVSPALGNIGKAFPDVGPSEIKMILTLPALFIIAFSLVSGALLKWFSKKQILVCGIIIYFIGGVGPVFVDSMHSILIYRAILGIGCGLIMPLSQTLIADFFTDDECRKMTGYSGAAANFMGIISAVFVGQLSSINWRYGFYIYSVAVIVLFLNLLALPSRHLVRREGTFSLNSKVYLLAMGMCLITIAFYAVPTNIALFMQQEHIGDQSTPGLVIAIFTAGGFFAGIKFGAIQQKFNKYTMPLGLVLMGLGYVLLFNANSLYQIILAVFLVGFSFGILYPLLFLKTGQAVDKNSQPVALSIVSSCLFLGQFLSPIVIQGISDLLSLHGLRFHFVILAVSLGLAFILNIVYLACAEKKRYVEKEEHFDE